MCASGGNAGYAVAYAGRQLGMAVTIVVPKTTSAWMQDILRRDGAEVAVQGEAWDDAHAHAVELAKHADAAYIHPFDDPIIWKGHASIIHEIAEAGIKPGAVVGVGRWRWPAVRIVGRTASSWLEGGARTRRGD